MTCQGGLSEDRAMNFPRLDPAERLARLAPPTGKVSMVLDTDPYNEIDDQFAIVHALCSSDRLNVEAIYAATKDGKIVAIQAVTTPGVTATLVRADQPPRRDGAAVGAAAEALAAR